MPRLPMSKSGWPATRTEPRLRFGLPATKAPEPFAAGGSFSAWPLPNARRLWKTAEQASQAIKLATGIVNLTKTPLGKMIEYPKSLSELDEPELERAFEMMVAVLCQVTGVDVLSLKKEALGNEGEA